MSGEIVVSETPNWLKTLEDKREQRLKARLGHEAGAGAPCLKCGDKCPGLDLHFWRKACKICRCPKEEHDVHDDDIYGWAQFQLLGSKPNKIKTKIVLPGKKDEVELEWAPKGQKETIDKYLKTLPPEILPVKGSQAAQERKQMLQKQIPIHDIDPALCHELNEEEVKKMEDYVAHIKKSSVGVGQIVNLSSVIKANLHNISPQEAHIIASRYAKGIPFSEIVKLQSGLAKNLEKLTLNDPKSPKNKSALPNMQPNKLGGNISEGNAQNPLIASKFKDITHPWYTDSSPNKALPKPQYAHTGFKSGQPGGLHSKNPEYQPSDYSVNQKLLEGTNFDPTKTPSQFLGYHTPGYRPVQHGDLHSQGQYHNTEGLPYDKVSGGLQSHNTSFSSEVEKLNPFKSGGLGGRSEGLPPYHTAASKGDFKHGDVENIEGLHGSGKNYAQNLQGDKDLPHSERYGFENPYFSQNLSGKDPNYSKNLGGTSSKTNLPGYSPNKYESSDDIQDPQAPKSVKDLIYSTYDPSKGPLPQDNDENIFKTIHPSDPGYDPNVTFNTYKHDPSVVKYENQPFLGKNDPAQPLGGNNPRFGPGNLKNMGYFDSKTGNVIPSCDNNPEGGIYDHTTLGHGNYGPGHPNYDPKHPYGSGYVDPKTGKFIPSGYNNPEGDNYDPTTLGHGNVGPGHPNYDPKHPYGSGYVDPKTGKFMPSGYDNPEGDNYEPTTLGPGNYGPGHPNYDPKHPYGSGYVDPKTGKFIPSGYNNPEGDNYEPMALGPGNYGPGHPNYDPKHPPRSGYVDPKTGKFIPSGYNNPEGNNYDPTTLGHGNYGPGHPNYDPKHPYGSGYVDPKTGKFIPSGYNNPEGDNYEPTALGHGNFGPGFPNYDPKHSYGSEYVDPKIGKFTPSGGSNLEGGKYDPTTLEQGNFGHGQQNYNPKNPYGSGYVDPKTGKYIPEGDNNFGPGINDTTLNPNGSGYFDPKTGKYVSGPGNFDPKARQYANPQSNPGYGNIESSTDPSGNLASNRPQNIPGIDNFDPNNPEAGHYPNSKLGNSSIKPRKPLSQLQPGQINVPEDYLEPHMVNVGTIQDINPDIKAATTEANPGFDNESVYSDNGVEYSPESIKEILNNIKLPDCHYCKKPFDENEYAVALDRANVLFHAQCFKCAGCNQSLADNIYFYHKESNNVYCGRDYAKIKGYPRCAACDELIFTKEYCLAENSTFHLKHFCCFQCDTPLAGQDYTLEEEKPYCLPCYETSKAAKCSTCEKVIKPDEVGCQLNGVHFHAEDRCFKCIVCNLPLMGKKLLLRNEKLFCSHDCFNSVKK